MYCPLHCSVRIPHAPDVSEFVDPRFKLSLLQPLDQERLGVCVWWTQRSAYCGSYRGSINCEERGALRK